MYLDIKDKNLFILGQFFSTEMNPKSVRVSEDKENSFLGFLSSGSFPQQYFGVFVAHKALYWLME